MKKTIISLLGVSLMTSSLYASVCSEKLSYDFTFYGAADKSYVVTKNTFKTSTANFPNGKLLNSTLNIDAFSIDTSADMSNGKGKWPASMAILRNNNTINNFFKKFNTDAGKIDVKIIKVGDSSMDLEFKMNGMTQVIPFSYKINEGMIEANGKLDVLAFGTETAWQRFSSICKGFHKGKSWNEIDVNFTVPASCK